MVQLAVALEEGFDDDTVIVRVGDNVVFEDEAVRTRTQIGRAKGFNVDVPAGDVAVAVDVPRRGLSTTFTVTAPTQLGISIKDGQVIHRTSDEPFRYA